MATLLWLTSDYLLSAFSDNPVAIDTAKSYLLIVTLTFSFQGLVMMTSSMANGIGNPIPALIFTLLRLLVLYLPLVWLLTKYFDIQGIFIATAASNLIVGIAVWYWSFKKCRGEDVLQTVPRFIDETLGHPH